MSLAASAPPAQAAERHDHLIHSDRPLWGTASGLLWPRGFSGEDGSFGCANRLSHGDWRFDETAADGTPASAKNAQDGRQGPRSWYRLTNHGVFHCAMVVRDAPDRAMLASRDFDYSYLVELGTISTARGPLETWALQRGTRPGSSYVLLSRRPGTQRDEGFDVLQRECPRGRTRKGPKLDVFGTTYCAINSRGALKALARRMAALPPLGRLSYVGPAPADD
jgi:hypothetical protein